MNSLLEDLLIALDKETVLYQSLLYLLNREKQAVVGLATDDLSEINKEKEALALKLRVFEKTRLELLKKLAEQMEISPDVLTLSYINDIVEEPYSTKLKTRSFLLLSLAHDIQELNRMNEKLISHSLDSINGSISLLCNLMSSGSTYLNTGRLHNEGGDGWLVRGRV